MRETADEPRTISAESSPLEERKRAELLHVALAAWAAHLDRNARVRIAGASTPWGRAARIAGLRRFDAR